MMAGSQCRVTALQLWESLEHSSEQLEHSWVRGSQGEQTLLSGKDWWVTAFLCAAAAVPELTPVSGSGVPAAHSNKNPVEIGRAHV